MGIGEDEHLDNAISVTIIATGFAPEMQQEIVHADPQKIIHSLGDEHKVTHDLAVGQIPMFEMEAIQGDYGTNNPVHDNLEQDIIQTTDLLRNLEVSFEEINIPSEVVEPQTSSFTIHDVTPPLNEIDVVDPEIVVPEKQAPSPIDQPLTKVNENQLNRPAVLFHLDDVEQPKQVIPTKTEVKRYVLDMEDEEVSETVMQNSVSTKKIPQVEKEQTFSPLDGTIAEGLAQRTEDRKEKLKQFNHSFSQNKRVEDLEREPAYKRYDVELENPGDGSNPSRTSLSIDSKNETQLRSNNSFLHDNVD